MLRARARRQRGKNIRTYTQASSGGTVYGGPHPKL